MTTTVMFHSVLGIRPGLLAAADRLREAGHEVTVPDLFEGRVFDDYDEAIAFQQTVGHPAVLARAMSAVDGVPDGFVSMGFSMGCAPAVYAATQRRVSGVLMVAGAIPASAFELGLSWPAGVPAQIHQTLDDPWREPEMLAETIREITDAGAEPEVFDCDGKGHLFMDPSLPAEYDEQAAALFWTRALGFIESRGA